MATPSKLRNRSEEYAARLRSRVAKSPLQKKSVPARMTTMDVYMTHKTKFDESVNSSEPACPNVLLKAD